jgi:hypothetical protein
LERRTLWHDFGHRAAVLGAVYSRVEEILPFLVKHSKTLDKLSSTGRDRVSIVRNHQLQRA